MRNVLNFDEVNLLMGNYFDKIVSSQKEAIEDCKVMQNTFSSKRISIFKNRTLGSFFNERLFDIMKRDFILDKNVRFIEKGNMTGVVFFEKVLIRFNKMSDNFKTAINKNTKPTKKFLNQMEIDGFPPLATLVWGGYNPEKSWDCIKSHYLVCFNDIILWHYDMGRKISSQQLSLNLAEVVIEPKKKRVTPKKRPQQDNKKTGTDNQ